MVFCLIVALALVAILMLGAWEAAASSLRAGRTDLDWLPAELRGAALMWSEKQFTCSDPVPMVARIDRAYRGIDGTLTLVEFKRRGACRAYPSDIVELSVQRHVLQACGHVVNRRAYVVIMPTGSGCTRALAVRLEDEQAVERRTMRLLALRDGHVRPNAPMHPGVCRSCGHRDVCSRSPDY